MSRASFGFATRPSAGSTAQRRNGAMRTSCKWACSGLSIALPQRPWSPLFNSWSAPWPAPSRSRRENLCLPHGIWHYSASLNTGAVITPRLWIAASAALLPAHIWQCPLPRIGSSEPCASPSSATKRVHARNWTGRKALSRAVSILDTTGGTGQRGSLFASCSRRPML